MSTSAALQPSCDEALLSGCLAGGNHWVLLEHDNGSTELVVAETGLPADPDDIVDCEEAETVTRRDVQIFSTAWSRNGGFNGTGNTLIAWEVKCDVAPVTIVVNGVSAAMDEDEVIRVEAQDGRVLRDTVTVSLGNAASRAEVMTVRRRA